MKPRCRYSHHVAEHLHARQHEGRDDYEQSVPAEELDQRHAAALAAREQFDEHRSLLDLAAHLVANADQRDREQSIATVCHRLRCGGGLMNRAYPEAGSALPE